MTMPVDPTGPDNREQAMTWLSAAEANYRNGEYSAARAAAAIARAWATLDGVP